MQLNIRYEAPVLLLWTELLEDVAILLVYRCETTWVFGEVNTRYLNL